MSNAAGESSTSGNESSVQPKRLRRVNDRLNAEESILSTMAQSAAGEPQTNDTHIKSEDLPSFMQQKGPLAHSDDVSITGLDEKEMRRHLMDIESSFLPDATSAAVAPEVKTGVDDTYLQLAEGNVKEEDHTDNSLLSSSGIYDENHKNEETADLRASTASSPAAAAAHRNLARGATAVPTHVLERDHHDADAGRPESSGSTIRMPSSPASHEQFSPIASVSETLNGRNQLATARPGAGMRHVSHRSILSSTTQDSEHTEEGGVDFALQTGGSLSGRGVTGSRAQKNLFARLPSLGSVSSITSVDDKHLQQRGALGRSILTDRRAAQTDERPETPRGPQYNYDAPIDTAIAKHVQSIQVPDTVARDFRLRNRSASPEKRPQSSGGPPGTVGQDRPRKTLTLKEQNSKIDKLTKENFDLKLKIHFLDQALQNRSDDGVKTLIEQNVQLQTDLANERKESQMLRRKTKDLERKVNEQADLLSKFHRRSESLASNDDDPTLQAEMHEEILYLRQQLDHTETTISTLREHLLAKESESRSLADHMRAMAAQRGADSTAAVQETDDMWRDLLDAETVRREAAEEDLSRIRTELTALRMEKANAGRGSRRARSDIRDEDEEDALLHVTPTSAIGNGALAQAATAALLEQLKHENGELRRDLGAQTSMLTSRNRERERLQQEIEDLKLLVRKGDSGGGGGVSVAGESIFDRSISRAHQRAPSRASEHTQAATLVTEAEREEWERKEGKLRDGNAELRLKFQELERTHATHLQYVTALEGDFAEMEGELNEAQEDLVKLQAERDEALLAFEERDQELVQLKEEALREITALDEEKKVLEGQLEAALVRQKKYAGKLQTSNESYKDLQSELREITQGVMNLEDEKQANLRSIQTLEQQIAEAEDEIQKLEQKLSELDTKNRKLEITQESLQSEVTFLREEQEGDKIKIGELEDALKDGEEKMRELEEGVMEERQQRDVLENKSKDEVQKVLDDLNAEHAKIKDELRKLRRAFSAKEVEANGWKQKHEDFEQAFQRALGDTKGTKQSLVADVERLLADLETTISDLDRAKMDLADKDRLLRHREGLLENSSLESRRLSDLLDKERTSRKHDAEQFEKQSRNHANQVRVIAQHEARVLELETSATQDKRKMMTMEAQHREQLQDRTALLLALWHRLSTLCGNDWSHQNGLINGELPSSETINKHLPSFNRNILAATRNIETIIGNFKTRIRTIEKDLTRDYTTLEQNLDMRVKRMDALERSVIEAQRALAEEAAQSRPSVPTRVGSNKLSKSTEETAKLRTEIRNLKSELKIHRQHPSALAQQHLNHHLQTQHPSSLSGGPPAASSTSITSPGHFRRQSTSGSSITSHASPARAIVNRVFSNRHHSTTSSIDPATIPPSRRAESPAPSYVDGDDAVQLREPHSRPASQQAPRHQSLVPAGGVVSDARDQRWVARLHEMERRLKAERDGRLADREGARVRLAEGRAENEELRGMLEREKGRRGLVEERRREGIEDVGAGGEGGVDVGERDVDGNGLEHLLEPNFD